MTTLAGNSPGSLSNCLNDAPNFHIRKFKLMAKKREAFSFQLSRSFLFGFVFDVSVLKSHRFSFRSAESPVQKRSYSIIPPPLTMAIGGVTVGITRVASAQVVLMVPTALVGGLRVAGSVRNPHAES